MPGPWPSQRKGNGKRYELLPVNAYDAYDAYDAYGSFKKWTLMKEVPSFIKFPSKKLQVTGLKLSLPQRDAMSAEYGTCRQWAGAAQAGQHSLPETVLRFKDLQGIRKRG